MTVRPGQRIKPNCLAWNDDHMLTLSVYKYMFCLVAIDLTTTMLLSTSRNEHRYSHYCNWKTQCYQIVNNCKNYRTAANPKQGVKLIFDRKFILRSEFWRRLPYIEAYSKPVIVFSLRHRLRSPWYSVKDFLNIGTVMTFLVHHSKKSEATVSTFIWKSVNGKNFRLNFCQTFKFEFVCIENTAVWWWWKWFWILQTSQYSICELSGAQ